MKVHACCGGYVGAPYWRDLDNFEPDECSWEDDIILDSEEWKAGLASFRCPRCTAWLYQSDDHFEPVEVGVVPVEKQPQ